MRGFLINTVTYGFLILFNTGTSMAFDDGDTLKCHAPVHGGNDKKCESKNMGDECGDGKVCEVMYIIGTTDELNGVFGHDDVICACVKKEGSKDDEILDEEIIEPIPMTEREYTDGEKFLSIFGIYFDQEGVLIR